MSVKSRGVPVKQSRTRGVPRKKRGTPVNCTAALAANIRSTPLPARRP